MTQQVGGGPLHKLTEAVRGVNKLVLAAPPFIAAVCAVVAYVAGWIDGPPPPPALEASFLSTTVEPGVFLEQYEEDSQSGLKADYEPRRSSARPIPAIYLQPSPPPARASVLTITSSASTTGLRATGTTSAQTAGTGAEAPIQADREEAAQAQREAQQKQAQAQQEEERQSRETQAQAAKVLAEEQQRREEGQLAEARALQEQQQEQAQTRLHHAQTLRRQAHAQEEEATVKASEATALAREEARRSPPAPQAQAPAPLHREGQAEVASGTATATSTVDETLRKAGVQLRRPCGRTCALRPTVDKAIIDYSSNLNEAARQVATSFQSSRVGRFEHELQPLGATVEYTLDFVGYAHQLLILEWTLCSKQSGRPLPREWWRNVIVEQIKPTSERVKVPGEFWAPLPAAPGDYFFRLRVFDGDSEVAAADTPKFQ